MRVGILGGGFGLYGYLPALVTGCAAAVVLPRRYRPILEARDDIRHLLGAIEWVSDDNDVLERADALIISRRPADQRIKVDSILLHPRPRRMILEKPLASGPEEAADLLHRVTASGRTIRIGYSFRYAPWARALYASLGDWPLETELTIVWTFRANHFAADLPTWKRLTSSGGGALRFYGVQLIGLLAEFGYDDALSSTTSIRSNDEAVSWHAVLTGKGLPRCRLHVETDSAEQRFSVHASGGNIPKIELTEPFAEFEVAGMLDRRVSLLTELCQDMICGEPASYPWYETSILLWGRIEARNQTLWRH